MDTVHADAAAVFFSHQVTSDLGDQDVTSAPPSPAFSLGGGLGGGDPRNHSGGGAAGGPGGRGELLPSAVAAGLLQRVGALLAMYVDPLAVGLGLALNLLVVAVLTRTPLRRYALSVYLTALATADCLYLAASLVVWLSIHHVHLYSRVGVCQVTTFALLLSKFLSTWFLFASCLERCVATFASGGSRKSWCSSFQAKWLAFLLCLLSIFAFVHNVWSSVVVATPRGPVCTVLPESAAHFRRLQKVGLVFESLLPAGGVTLMVLALAVSLVFNRRQVYQASVTSRRFSTRLSQALLSDYSLTRKESRCTTAVVACGIAFLLLELPAMCMRARMAYMPHAARSVSPEFFQSMKLADTVVKYNAVLKFFILFSLKPFRKGLCHLVKCCRCEKASSEDSFELSITSV